MTFCIQFLRFSFNSRQSLRLLLAVRQRTWLSLQAPKAGHVRSPPCSCARRPAPLPAQPRAGLGPYRQHRVFRAVGRDRRPATGVEQLGTGLNFLIERMNGFNDSGNVLNFLVKDELLKQL